MDKNREFYSTWQEAAIAAYSLGLNKVGDYQQGFWKDPKLHSNPISKYRCQGLDKLSQFFEYGQKHGIPLESDIVPYRTWQHAALACVTLEIYNRRSYKSRCSEDVRLMPDPHQTYKDFPEWDKFFKEGLRLLYLANAKQKTRRDNYHYATWQQASRAAIALGMKKSPEYRAWHTLDPKLPGQPEIFYPGFTDWYDFLGRKQPIKKPRKKQVKKKKIPVK